MEKFAREVNPDLNGVSPIKNVYSSAPSDAHIRVAVSPMSNCTLLSADDRIGLTGAEKDKQCKSGRRFRLFIQIMPVKLFVDKISPEPL